MDRVKDKVAAVTGGLRGLGLAVVDLCQEGARVMFTDIDSLEGLLQLERLTCLGYEVAFEVQDVTQPDAWPRTLDGAIARWGQLDVLVNNAGIAIVGDVEALTLDSWRKTLAVNLEAVFLGTQAVFPKIPGFCKNSTEKEIRDEP